jgi:hypothetical protein
MPPVVGNGDRKRDLNLTFGGQWLGGFARVPTKQSRDSVYPKFYPLNIRNPP